MTYSIAAVDADGATGVAVQTALPAVGAAVPWVEFGAGAVATQAVTNVAFGVEGLARMRAGIAAPDVLRDLVDGDDGRENRQVAMVDAHRRAAAHTGSWCIAYAGHVTGDGVSCQANIMVNDGTWETMLRAYHDRSGHLLERLLAALVSAEEAGGDLRGRQSAAVIVDNGTHRIDLRVDDHDDPVSELHRLVERQRAAMAYTDCFDLVAAGDIPGAIAGLERAQARFGARRDPDTVRAVLLASIDRRDEAEDVLRAAVAAQPAMAEYFVRVAAARSPLDAATTAAIVARATRR